MEKTKKEAKTYVSAAGPATAVRILVADDKKSIRDIISEFLEFIGYEVALAIDGVEALAVFLENSIDLVLTDLEMPAMDGLSLAGHIKENSPSTPVILLTGSDLEIGIDLFESVLLKPVMLEDLQSAIQTALASGEEKHRGIENGAMSRDFQKGWKSYDSFQR